MTHLRYSPAPSNPAGVLIARDDLLLVVSTSIDKVNSLWAAVDAGSDAGSILDVLTSGGISLTPPFALVAGLGSPRSVVMTRGAMPLTVASAAGEQVFDGSTVSSWIETGLDAVTAVHFGSRVAAESLPLVRGAVACSGAAWGTMSENPPIRPEEPSPKATELSEPLPVSFVEKPEDSPTVEEPATVNVSHATIAAPETSVQPLPPAPLPEAESAASYDHLFGETVMRQVEDAAVRDEGDEAPSDISDRTVVVEDIAALRAQRRAERGRSSPAPKAGPQFYLDLSTGGRELLDQPIIVGRAPSVNRASGSAMPRLVTMSTPNQDISRSHAHIAVEGDTVVVTDLHSMNGTMVTIPGKNPVRLREGEPTIVITGAVIDLGDGATLTVGLV